MQAESLHTRINEAIKAEPGAKAFYMSDRVYVGANPQYAKFEPYPGGPIQYRLVKKGIPFKRIH